MAAEFRLLGPVEAVFDGASVLLGGPKQRTLLAELLLHAREVVSRDHLIDALWEEQPPASAAGSLQVYVSGLRSALGRDRIETRGTGYRVLVEPEELDIEVFERLVRRGEAALAGGSPGEAEDTLMRALDLWRGEPLADLADSSVA